MRLELCEIIDIPGQSRSFDYELDVSGLEFDSVLEYKGPVRASGTVENEAGMLVLTGTLEADLLCQCARCLTEFDKRIALPVTATLVEEIPDEDNTELYLIDGTQIDLDEIFLTALVLNMEQKLLCSEDCRGLCPTCGKNLNEGPCDCRAEGDPRLAVLRQLLENN